MKTQTILKNSGPKKAPITPPPTSQTAAISSKIQSQSENDLSVISNPSRDEIAARAYKIWQEQGCPEGFNDAHWRLAEQEILGVSTEALAS